MNQKKILSTVLVGLLLTSVAIAIAPSIKADEFHSVFGYLYLKDLNLGDDTFKIAPAGVEIRLVFGSASSNDLTDEHGYYQIDFSGHEDETGIFYISYKVYTLTPENNKTVTIDLASSVNNEGYLYVIDDMNVIVPENHAPYLPSNPSPTNGATNVDTNADLSWTGGDPDAGDTVTYDVYFGTASPPPSKATGITTITYDPGTLAYETKYYWKIVAHDNHVDNNTATGPIWSFTTKSSPPSPPGGGGPTGGQTGGTTNTPPTADAGGPYLGIPNSAIPLDGTGSSDTDGTIVQYDWKFFGGDSWHNNISSKPTHVYDESGVYTITLRVHDDDGSTDEDTTTATIIAGNNPPTDPIVDGLTIGNKNTSYEYTAVSTDLDNDSISYTFDWGDGTDIETDFLPNGTIATQNHTWTAAGLYNIGVNAYDNKTQSGTTHYTVLIDTIYVKDIGYLIDTDGDGTYDVFHSNETNAETTPQKQDNGTYLINSDGVNGWDWIYDPTPDTLTPYSTGSSGEAKADNTLWYALSIGVILAIILLVIIYLATRKKQKPKK